MNSIVRWIVASLLLAVSPLASAEPAGADRPNIVLILCDDLGYADVGFNGAKDIVTPELDALAAGGVIFRSAYVAHPFCGPSRMGMMTGRYPHAFGAPFNLPNASAAPEGGEPIGVSVDEPLISTVLQEAGYYTGAVGKWHMGHEQPFHPNRRGFDDFYGFLGGGHQYFPSHYRPIYERQKKSGKTVFNDYIAPLEHNGQHANEQEYITDGLSREAARFVREASGTGKPFFLYLAYNAPHSPLQATESDLQTFGAIKDEKRRTYAAMVYAVDRGVGRVVQSLRDCDEYENTLIVFLSDNGGKLGLGADNGPLREGKGSTHEGGFRVPMFFHFPAKLAAGQSYEYPITALDFYPTFAGLAGAEIPDGKQIDGRDVFQSVVEGRDAREGEFVFALRHRTGFSDVAARRGNWKVCRTYNAPWKLFDLQEDLGERNDLSAKHPERVREMVDAAQQWSRTHTQPLWFDSQGASDGWHDTQMPQYESTFSIK